MDRTSLRGNMERVFFPKFQRYKFEKALDASRLQRGVLIEFYFLSFLSRRGK